MALPSVLLVLVACSPASPFHASIALKPVPPPPSVTKIPVTVGIYYAPAFRTYEHTWRQDGTTFHLNVGNASMRLLTACVAALAERTLVVARRPPLRAVPPVAAVIETEITTFNLMYTAIRAQASVTYRFTLYSSEGAALGSWTVTGAGASLPFAYITPGYGPRDAATNAMEDAAKTFSSGFHEVPEVQGWLQQVTS